MYLLLGGKVFGGTAVALASICKPNHLHLRIARRDEIDGLGYATLVGIGETTPLGQSSFGCHRGAVPEQFGGLDKTSPRFELP